MKPVDFCKCGHNHFAHARSGMCFGSSGCGCADYEHAKTIDAALLEAKPEPTSMDRSRIPGESRDVWSDR